jgi:hypothetical protein
MNSDFGDDSDGSRTPSSGFSDASSFDSIDDTGDSGQVGGASALVCDVYLCSLHSHANLAINMQFHTLHR